MSFFFSFTHRRLSLTAVSSVLKLYVASDRFFFNDLLLHFNIFLL